MSLTSPVGVILIGELDRKREFPQYRVFTRQEIELKNRKLDVCILYSSVLSSNSVNEVCVLFYDIGHVFIVNNNL